MNGKRFLAVLMSLCMLSGTVSNSAPAITHSITAQAASTNANCYSFNKATGALTLKGNVDGDILRESELQIYLAQNVKSVVAASGTVLPEDSSRLFYSYINCTSIDLSKADTSKVKDMNSMFYGCTNLTSLDISGFDTSNVTNMACMFCGCSSLSSLDVSGFNTSNVTNLMCMFWGCTSLTKLDLSRFNTSKATTIDSMFYGCYSLTMLDLSSFDTSNVTNMSKMFSYCGRIKTITLGKNFKKIATEASLPNGNGWVNVNAPKTVISGSESYANIVNDGNNIYRNPMACIKGDVNVDGVVNSDDRVLLQKWLVHMVSDNELDLENADVNFDGEIDVMDLVELSRLCKQNTNSGSGSSDGNTSGEEKTTEHIDARSEVFSNINTEENAFEVSLDITASGNAISSLNVEESGYSGVIKSDSESDMVVGVVPEFECEEGAVIDNVTLNFDIKDGFKNNTNGKYAEVSDEFKGIKRLVVFKYFKEIGMLLPVITTYDDKNNRVTAQVDELGTYCLIDVEKWFETLGIGPEAFTNGAGQTDSQVTDNTPIDIVFHDYAQLENDQNKVEDAIKDTAKQLFDEYGTNGNVRIYIAKYTGDIPKSKKGIIYAQNEEELNYLLDSISEVGSDISTDEITYKKDVRNLINNYKNLLRENADRYYVFVEHMRVEATTKDKSTIVNYLTANKLTAVILSNFSDYDSFAMSTGGTHIESRTNFGKDVANFIINKHGENPDKYVGITPLGWKKIPLDKPIVPQYKDYLEKLKKDPSMREDMKSYCADSDGDGLFDFEEINFEKICKYANGNEIKIKWDENGNVILPTFEECMSGISFTFLAEAVKGKTNEDLSKMMKCRILPIITDPSEQDTDKDGVSDFRDAKPIVQAPYFDRLKETDAFSDDANDLLIEEMKELLDKAYLKEQKSLPDDIYEVDYYPDDIRSRTIDESYGCAYYPNDIRNDLIGKKAKARAEFAGLPYLISSDVWNAARTEILFGEASSAMSWFLDNTGIDRVLSVDDIKSLLKTNSGRYRYQATLSGVADYAKNVLKDGDTVILASKKAFSSFKKGDDDIKVYDPGQLLNDCDWFCTLGEASGAIIAKIKRDGDYYNMEYTYNVIDYYDWDINRDFALFEDVPGLKSLTIQDAEFAKMHLAGIARSYFQHGKISGELDFSIHTDPDPFPTNPPYYENW